MPIEHHDLIHELPEHKARIHDLKISDAHFKRLFNEYHELTREIENIEKNESNIDDVQLKEMKVHRLDLKDQLYKTIKQTPA